LLRAISAMQSNPPQKANETNALNSVHTLDCAPLTGEKN
jgi:hypothetical protein